MRKLFSILAFWPLLLRAQPSQLLGVTSFAKWSPVAPGGGTLQAPGYVRGIATNSDYATILTNNGLVVSGANKTIVAMAAGGGTKCTGVKFGDHVFTKLFETNYYDATAWCELFYLVAPGNGTSNVVATFDGTSDCGVACMLFTNTAQASTIGDLGVDYATGGRSGATNTVNSLVTDMIASFVATQNIGVSNKPTLTFSCSGTIAAQTMAKAAYVVGSAGTTTCAWTNVDSTPRITLINVPIHGNTY